MSLFYKCPIKALLNEHFDNPDNSDCYLSGSEQGEFVEVHHTPTGQSIIFSPTDTEVTQLAHEYEVYIDILEALQDLQFLAEEEEGEFAIDTVERDIIAIPYGDDKETVLFTTLSKEYISPCKGTLREKWTFISEAEYGHEITWTLYDVDYNKLAQGTIGDEE